MHGLTRPEIYQVVNGYIGVSGGYLGDFSYRSHQEFYPYYCDLDIDPLKLSGTTRERFIAILEEADPSSQAKILRGVLSKYPAGSEPQRTEEKFEQIAGLIRRLEGEAVPAFSLAASSRAVEEALKDVEVLVAANGATSAIDRIHTALHGYMIAALTDGDIEHDPQAGLPALYSRLRSEHPRLNEASEFGEEVSRIVRSFGGIIESLNTFRNDGSRAHPNEILLAEAEAHLAINTARTILHYLDAKLAP